MKNMIRRPRVQDRLDVGRSTTYDQVADGLLPPPVRVGARCAAWPEHEIDAIISARIAGHDDDQIRRLVAKLVEARKYEIDAIISAHIADHDDDQIRRLLAKLVEAREHEIDAIISAHDDDQIRHLVAKLVKARGSAT